MSQRECAGFNWPALAVSAVDPVAGVPEASDVDCASVSPNPLFPCFAAATARRCSHVESVRLPALASGVGQLANVNACSESGLPRVCSARPARNSGEPEALCQSLVAGVAQEAAIEATCPSDTASLRPSGARPVALSPSNDCEPSALPTTGVGQPVEALSDVRRADGRSAQTDRCEGVADTLQVKSNSVEPAVRNRCFNLFAKDSSRSALEDELSPNRPKMTAVGHSRTATGGRERLTRATSRPDLALGRPAGEGKGEGPASDAGEKVTGGIAGEVSGSNIGN
jgi:hypothetical protein